MNENTKDAENLKEVVEKLKEAQEQIVEAISLMDEVVQEIPSPYHEAYVLNNLKAHTSDRYGYLCRDSIDAWIEAIEREEGEEEEEDIV